MTMVYAAQPAIAQPAIAQPAFPALTERQVANARLFSDRTAMFRSFVLPQGSTMAEIGVATGGWTEFLLEFFHPAIFVAFDLFDLDKLPIIWGQPTAEVFGGKTHYDYYRDRFLGVPTRMVLEKGFSHETLARYPDEYFDLIYVDAGHDYEDVARDGELTQRKLKPNGIAIFNDYIMLDHIHRHPYGVVQAVNELAVKYDWRVIGLALQREMFCDIAIRKIPAGTDDAVASAADAVQPYPWLDVPALASRHLAGAALFADRGDMVRELNFGTAGVVAELGVAEGGFSRFLLAQLRPRTFVAFDAFDLDAQASFWGRPTAELFQGKSHIEYYRDKFAAADTRIVLEPGSPRQTMEHYPDDSFDIIYIKGGFFNSDLWRVVDLAARKLKPGGAMIVGDYIMMDHLARIPYSVVNSVNRLVVQNEWRVIGVALQQQMFCDIALRKPVADSAAGRAAAASSRPHTVGDP